MLDDQAIATWDRLADGLQTGGVEGFMAAYDHDLSPEWRQTVLRITRSRMGEHRNPQAVAQAMRELARSRPFESLSELELADIPALVVASHDVADPGHPYSVAAAYAESLPRARLISEEAAPRRSHGRAGGWHGRSPPSAQSPRWRRGRAGEALSLPAMVDDGHAIHYSAVEPGTPVYASDGIEVGRVDQVVDNYRERIFDGIVLETTDGELRFVDAPRWPEQRSVG